MRYMHLYLFGINIWKLDESHLMHLGILHIALQTIIQHIRNQIVEKDQGRIWKMAGWGEGDERESPMSSSMLYWTSSSTTRLKWDYVQHFGDMDNIFETNGLRHRLKNNISILPRPTHSQAKSQWACWTTDCVKCPMSTLKICFYSSKGGCLPKVTESEREGGIWICMLRSCILALTIDCMLNKPPHASWNTNLHKLNDQSLA